MSKIKTRKEIGEELQAKSEELEAVKSAHSEELNTINASLVDAQNEITILKTNLEEVSAGLENAIKERDEMIAKAGELEENFKSASEELDSAKKLLENPGIQDAAGIIPCEIDQKLEDAEADLAEDDGEEEPELTIAEKYESMPAGAERSAFWKQHKRAIIAEYEKSE